MSTTRCSTCPTEIPNGQAVIRSVALKRVVKCRPCAVDAGWTVGHVPSPRKPSESQQESWL